MTRYKTMTEEGILYKCAGAVITWPNAATTGTAAVHITHHHTLPHTSIKSVCRLASPMDIFRLPDTGLIRGHIISAVTSLRKCFKRRSRRGMERADETCSVGFKTSTSAFTADRSSAKTARCLITNGSQQSPTCPINFVAAPAKHEDISRSCICLPLHRLSFCRLL